MALRVSFSGLPVLRAVRRLEATVRFVDTEWLYLTNKYTGTMIMSQYLGRGSTSRGRMTIQPSLQTIVSRHPYLRDENDVAAVVKGIDNVRAALNNFSNLTFAVPDNNTTTQAYVDQYLVSPQTRRANHWMG
jgi:cellobiose dehydrogenase (acceptor)